MSTTNVCTLVTNKGGLFYGYRFGSNVDVNTEIGKKSCYLYNFNEYQKIYLCLYIFLINTILF